MRTPPRVARAGRGRPPSPGLPSRRRSRARRRRPSGRGRTRRGARRRGRAARRRRGSRARTGSRGGGRSGRRDARRRSRRSRRPRPSTDSRRTAGSEVAPSSLTAQMPMKFHALDPASEPMSVTSRTGRSARSTSAPQIRCAVVESRPQTLAKSGSSQRRSRRRSSHDERDGGARRLPARSPRARRAASSRLGPARRRRRHGDGATSPRAARGAARSRPRRAARISLLWLCSFTRPRSPCARASPSRALGPTLFDRQVSAERPPSTSVGTTVRKR